MWISVEDGRGERWDRFMRHASMVRAYIRRFVRADDDVEDVFQDVGLIVWRHPSGPSDPRFFAAWCRGLVRHVVLEHRRRWRRDAIEDVGATAEEASISPDTQDTEHLVSLREQLMRIWDRASPAAQGLILRRYLLGESASDIASELGSSAVAVRMKLKRARTALSRGRGERSSAPPPLPSSSRDEAEWSDASIEVPSAADKTPIPH
jgi:RNA polymerase sigma-70 factor, ECF subfamily